MSIQANKNALALHEILLSISDSLNEAQNQLRNMPPYDQYGRPNTLYQMPYLDFSLEVISEINVQSQSSLNVTPTTRTIGTTPQLFSGVRRNFNPIPIQALKFSPAPPSTSSNSSFNKITSTISGRFVAIMPNEGLPQVFLSLGAESNNGSHKLSAKMQLATGEPVVGQKLEINIDWINTNALNDNLPEGINIKLESGNEGFTNGNGEFETNAIITGALPNLTFVFVANSGTIFKSVAITT